MEKTDLKAQLGEVAQRIRTMREITGLSEEEMARCTGVSTEEYAHCEEGEQDFSFTFIYKCAKRFGVDPTDLIRGVSPTLSSYTIVRHGDAHNPPPRLQVPEPGPALQEQDRRALFCHHALL